MTTTRICACTPCPVPIWGEGNTVCEECLVTGCREGVCIVHEEG